MNTFKLQRWVYLATLTVVVCTAIPLSVFADTTVIENTVKTSASTGGNNSTQSSNSGQATSHVEIKTVINGEVVEDIDETIKAPPGQDAVLEKNVEVKLPEPHASISAQAEVEKKSDNKIFVFLGKIFKYIFSILVLAPTSQNVAMAQELTPEEMLAPEEVLVEESVAVEEVVEEEPVTEEVIEETAEEESIEQVPLQTEPIQITTGNAYASANVISAVNFNLVDSNGFLYLLNNFLNSLGHVDLRMVAPSINTAGPLSDPCGASGCNATTTPLSVDAINNAEIANTVIVRSSTGSNQVQGGNAAITTGNAYAGANVVNIANTNIIDSNYLLFAFNNFGGWNGDLIMPNSDFFSSFFSPQSNSSSQTSLNNSANIGNNVEVSADTGENDASGDANSIDTGSAVAGTNVSNIANTNLLDTSSFFVVFRIFGAWNGSVFNAPEGISWTETPSGIELFSTGNGGGATSTPGQMNLTASSSANITNNVQVLALTGENRATSTNGFASIDTGNAYAGANIINIANTNVISSNWIVALINIFGDWNGNISFGQPDLWVATQVEAPNFLTFGSEVTFHTTVANRGDAPASKVMFRGHFDSTLADVREGSSRGLYKKDLGSLMPGEVEEFSYSMKITDDSPFHVSALINHTFDISALETDGNPVDNSDSLSLVVTRPGDYLFPGGQSTSITSTYPSLFISKTNSATTTPVSASSTVEYTITVKNKGGSAFDAVLYDALKDENGNIISKNDWALGEILQDEEITISYDATYNASTTPGVYTNYAWVEANGKDYEYGRYIWENADSNIATSSVVVVNSSDSKDLATSTEVFITEVKIVEDIETVLAILDEAPKVIIDEERTREPRFITKTEPADASIPQKESAHLDFNPWSIALSIFMFARIKRY